jgi:hypothetical protein
MQFSRILDIAGNRVLQTLLHVFACMLENAVLNVFRVVARLLTRDITRYGGVYRLWFLGCRAISISHSFRPMLWDAWNASDFQTHCISASAMTRTEAPLPDTLRGGAQGSAGSDVSVTAIAPPPLPRGVAELLTGGPSEALQSQVRPVLKRRVEEGRR